MLRILRLAAAVALLPLAASAQVPGYQPPQHTGGTPLIDRASPPELAFLADQGLAMERDRHPVQVLAEHRRLATALATLQPQRAGTVDAYVVSVALDSDPVFGREAREAGRVLARRYAATGRTIVLAGSDGSAESSLAMGSPASLTAVLARVAELMDGREDVLVLYTTSHGAPFGIVYNDGDQGFGAISPTRLWQTLSTLGIRNRLLLISACYSGIFVPLLASDTTAILTASSAERTSFGCQADNDWTFFGDAMINQALRRPTPLGAAGAEAATLIGGWERAAKLEPSQPQISIGAGAARWLNVLEARLPAATPKVGRPATASLDGATAPGR
ncbi:MAG: peptidase [Sphingomonas bacterium]|uniref:C13 family peptidase n=1 Tax=Sphingomonas bacterium TaxID=1895847 RepID=UPI002629E40B|nr:C13 family peptidase [Sphingomonas bacterium]MDB5694718.1 peptidase [Sphingomonas bacterium]